MERTDPADCYEDLDPDTFFADDPAPMPAAVVAKMLALSVAAGAVVALAAWALWQIGTLSA